MKRFIPFLATLCAALIASIVFTLGHAPIEVWKALGLLTGLVLFLCWIYIMTESMSRNES